MRLEAVRIEHEDQMVVIEEQKAEKLRQIETEEAVQLEILRQSREDCAQQGDGREATCREEHDKTLDEIRTERDTQLEAVRVQSGEDQLQVIAEAKEELVKMQAQLEQQLKNIREQRFDEIEKIMRKCEGGAEEACPVFDCSMCEGKNWRFEAVFLATLLKNVFLNFSLNQCCRWLCPASVNQSSLFMFQDTMVHLMKITITQITIMQIKIMQITIMQITITQDTIMEMPLIMPLIIKVGLCIFTNRN